METRVLPEIVLKRKVCEYCGEGIFEFGEETQTKQEFICASCST